MLWAPTAVTPFIATVLTPTPARRKKSTGAKASISSNPSAKNT